MATGLINANPTVYERKERRVRNSPIETDEYAEEPIDQLEIFDILQILPISLTIAGIYLFGFLTSIFFTFEKFHDLHCHLSYFV